MIRILGIGFALGWIFLGAAAQTHHVIISPLIGDTLDTQERLDYRLFPEVGGFRWAVFTMDEKSSSIKAKIFFMEQGRSKIRITNLGHVKFLQANIASAAGLSPSVAASWEITVVPPPETKPQRKSAVGTIVVVRDAQPPGISFPESGIISDDLPLAPTPPRELLEPYPDWGISVSFASFGVDLGSLNSAFEAVEDTYRSQGNTINRENPNFKIGTLLSYALQFRLLPEFTLHIETSFNDNESAVFRSFSAVGLFYFDPFHSKVIRPFLGAGAGRFYFAGTVRHGEPIGAQGSYLFLDKINFEAGGLFFPVKGGIEGISSAGLSFAFYAGYLLAPPQKTRVGNEEAVLNMSGSIFAGQITIYF